MSKTFQKSILNLNVSFDLDEWVKTFELLSSNDIETDFPDDIVELGPTAFAAVVMGIIESHAREKTLVKGTTEPLRHQALSLFIGTITDAAFWNGQADMMNYLVNEKPNLTQFFNEVHIKRSVHRRVFKKKVAAQALLLLKEIRAQKLRKGSVGRHVGGIRLNTHPVLKLRDSIDEAILNDAVVRLQHIDRDNAELINQQIRILVKEFLAKGIIHQTGATYKDCVDTHCKRIIRKSKARPVQNSSDTEAG